MNQRIEDVVLNVAAVLLAALLWLTGAGLLLVEGRSRRLTTGD